MSRLLLAWPAAALALAACSSGPENRSPGLRISDLPASARAGEPRSFTVTALSGRATDAAYAGTVRFASDDPLADLPPDTTFVPGDQGVRSFTVTFRRAGARSLYAQDLATAAVATSAVAVTAGDPSALQKSSGDGQSAFLGQRLSLPLVARVVDAFGNPVAGIAVAFAASGGGAVDVADAVTGADGRASTLATLGEEVGTYAFTASAAGATATFAASAKPPPGSTLVALAAGGSAEVGTRLDASPLVVKVVDGTGSPVRGATVSWSAQVGNGGVAPASSVTGADGTAFAVATLGAQAGANVFRAVVADVAGSPVTFAWTGVAGLASQLIAAGGDLQRWVPAVSARLPDPLIVKATDRFGNGLQGIAVAFAGSVDSPACTTAQDGTCATTALVSPGLNTYTATSGSLSPWTFQAFGLAEGLVYTDPGPGKLRLVRNPASSPVELALDLVAGAPLTGFSAGYDIALAPGQVVLAPAPIAPGDALPLGAGLPALAAALPTSGPLASVLATGLSQKAPAPDVAIAPGRIFYTVRLRLRNYGVPGDPGRSGPVFDGAVAGAVLSAGLRDLVGQDQLGAPSDFALGRLEVR